MSKVLFTSHDITTTYTGRNGTGKCIGLNLTTRIKTTGDVVCVTIAPVNSKELVANCNIDIPVNDIDSVIAALNEVKKTVHTHRMKAGESLINPPVHKLDTKNLVVDKSVINPPDVLKLCGNMIVVPLDKKPVALPEFFSTADTISYTERGFFVGFTNKHVAKDAMNEILHAYDEAGMDKSNLVGDVLNGISNQLDEAFGNDDWDDVDQA